MRLGALFTEICPLQAKDLPFAGLTSDSRLVQEGWVFFAIPGTKGDGLAFVGQAISKGASALVVASDAIVDTSVPVLHVADVRAALSKAAAHYYPRQPETIVAITGTSGKTSIAAFVRQIWARLGLKAASLGTIGVVTDHETQYGSLTTPDPVSLHQTLDKLAGEGITHLVMEASSHGLEQERLDGVRLSAGGFSNLSRDHLDYHATEAAYLAAKMRLFDTLLKKGQPAVIDADSRVADEVIAHCKKHGLNVLTTGARADGIKLVSAVPEGWKTRLLLRYKDHDYGVLLPLAGTFQVANALLAAGLCLVTGSDAGGVFAALEGLEGAQGRLEHVGTIRNAPIFVDYAHKPDALENVLTTLRPLAKARLILVFGCGGDRDKGKRPIMGDIAARLADIVIVTDDNPRSESPGQIRTEILASAPDAREIGDRAEAIITAINLLKDGDVLVIAGKGHETGQIIGDRTLPFSDHEVVRQALGKSF